MEINITILSRDMICNMKHKVFNRIEKKKKEIKMETQTQHIISKFQAYTKFQ